MSFADKVRKVVQRRAAKEEDMWSTFVAHSIDF